jgi:hypothetical protein
MSCTAHFFIFGIITCDKKKSKNQELNKKLNKKSNKNYEKLFLNDVIKYVLFDVSSKSV